MNTRPVWRFSLMDMEGPFSFSDMRPEHMPDVLQRLRSFETTTWGEIRGTKNHYLAEGSVSNVALKRLAQLELLEHESNLFSLRFGKDGDQARRLIGLLYPQAFYLLWWDPDHAVCPSTLRNT